MQLEVIGLINGNKQPLTVIKRKLSPGILLCLFEGKPLQVDFHLQPEVLHFGFNREEDGGAFMKSPRNDKGIETEIVIDLSNPKGVKRPDPKDVILKAPSSGDYNGILNIENLFNTIKEKWENELSIPGEFSAAQFALSMIEGVDKVRFLKK